MGASLRLAGRVLDVSAERPLLMGVVNASPESFSDGHEVGGVEAQVARGLELVAEGAGIIDVGGESGVTGTPPSEPAEEIARVAPVIERLAAEGVVVSVDTWKPAVADVALKAGACMVNDVSGLRDRGLAAACARHGAALVVMHTRAAPKHKDFPAYTDVVADVEDFIEAQLAIARAEGVAEDQLVVDPGPDFAKTPAQTVRMLREVGRLHRFGRPILLAVSRKDFVGALTGTAPRGRGPGTLAAISEGLDAGASILRVHDVAATAQFIQVRNALRGVDAVPEELRLPDDLRREPGR